MRAHAMNPAPLVAVIMGSKSDWETLRPAAEMLDHPKHRVGNAVDIREEGLRDDRNAHAPTGDAWRRC